MKKYLILFIILGLASCKPLPEGYGLDKPEQYSRIYLAEAYNGVKEMDLEAPAEVKVEIFANYSGVIDLKNDVTVTLGADLSLVPEYNTSNGTEFKALPEACFNMEKDKTVILAGESTASEAAVLNIITAAFEDDSVYLLPIRITDVSDSSIELNSDLDKLFLGIKCAAGTVSISSNPLTDYDISDTENW